MLTTGLAEEPGWHDFALPRLQERFGALGASLILGPVWGFWHLPLFFSEWGGWPNSTWTFPVLFMASAISITFVITYVFNRTGGSLPIVMLLHVGVNNTSSVLLPGMFPSLSSDTILMASFLAATAVAVVMLVLTRGRLGYVRPTPISQTHSMVATQSRYRPGTTDVVVGAGCVVLSVVSLVMLPVLTAGSDDAALLDSIPPMSSRWFLLLIGVVVQGVVLMWIRTAPRTVLIGIAAVGFCISWLTPAGTTGITSVAIVAAVFLAVLREPLARTAVAVSSAYMFFIAGEIVNGMRGESPIVGQVVFTGVVQGVVIIGIPILIALFARAKTDAQKARRDEQVARTGERDALIEAAIARERTAMARELHDIAAHHLSGIALMAAAVDRQIESSPEQARIGVRQLRAQSTAVLDDLRRIVGLLRDDAGDQRSVETLATVPELVERARAQGDIDLQVLTAAGRDLGAGIGPLTQLALYRTIQEALTNAAAHAPGASRLVRIDDRDEARTEVSVVNLKPLRYIPPSPSGGFGLLGMRERADLVGADLRFGPTPEGGWQVRASVAREASMDAGFPDAEPITPEARA